MNTLHVRAASGPRAVSAETVRGLLASGALRPDQRAVSLDGGMTWIGAEDALAALAADAVPDAAVAAASATSGDGLHPLAVPVGGLAVITLATALAFGGGPTVDLATVPAQTCATCTAVVGTAAETAQAVLDRASGLASCGWSLVSGRSAAPVAAAVPAVIAAPAQDKPADQPATAAADDLLASWRDFLKQGAESPKEVWKARADALGQQTVRLGLAGWSVRLTESVPVAEADRPRVGGIYPGTKDQILEAICDVPGASLTISGVIVDKNVAKVLDPVRKGSEVKITATCLSTKADPEKRTVDLIVAITAAE